MAATMDNARAPEVKRRRALLACVACKARKLRCDRGENGRKTCTSCEARGGMPCELAEPKRPLKSYLEQLKMRVQELEGQVEQLTETVKILRSYNASSPRGSDTVAPPPAFSPRSTVTDLAKALDSQWTQWPPLKHYSTAGSSGPHSLSHTKRELGFLLDEEEPTVTSGEQQQEVETLTQSLRDTRFFGKSSGAVLISNITQMQRELLGPSTSTTCSGGNASPNETLNDSTSATEHIWTWNTKPWELAQAGTAREHTPFEFPDPELVQDLVELYFTHSNLSSPILHRPTFDAAFANGEYLTEGSPDEFSFRSVLLLVLAIGSRYSDDPRVLLDPSTQHSAGSAFFNEVKSAPKSVLSVLSLYGIQYYCLCAVFLMGRGAHGAWMMCSVGLRLSLDVGAHRRMNTKPTVESELWKRAFWFLISCDRHLSVGMGRPPTMEDEEFDQELPIEVDDAYWENGFRQPLGQPSTVSCFVAQIKLMQIIAFARRTIYSSNQSKIWLGCVGPDWERHIVAQLDSSLNGWVDALPGHLRWDPHCEHPVFAVQQAALYGAYYQVQITVHRAFVPSPKRPQGVGNFPSLSICTNSARACCHVFDKFRDKPNFFGLPAQTSAFNAGLMILLSLWTSKRSGTNYQDSLMDDAEKCLYFLERHASRWQIAAQVGGVLHKLVNNGRVTLQSLPSTNKRRRDFDAALSPQMETDDGGAPRNVAGSRRAAEYSSSAPSTSWVPFTFKLPIYTNELGATASTVPQDASSWFFDETAKTSAFEGYSVQDRAFLEELEEMEKMFAPSGQKGQSQMSWSGEMGSGVPLNPYPRASWDGFEYGSTGPN